MKLTFLGGAQEIGATCYLLELAGKAILIDAGSRIRPHYQEGYYPRLSCLKHVDAVLVTHAHMDHVGAIPAVVARFPSVPVIMTEASYLLSQINWKTSVWGKEVLHQHAANKEWAYSWAERDQTLSAVMVVPFNKTFQLFCDVEVKVTYVPAGHILGAASIIIEAEGKVVMTSGDFSMTDQHTLQGVRDLAVRPDVLIMESTYAESDHGSRKEEEDALADTVNKAVHRGGNILFPCFAIGRAQEVALCLFRLRLQRRLPSVPIWVDGAVRRACVVYRSFGVFSVPTGRAGIQIVRAHWRDALTRQRGPQCMIASSGTLAGGPSVRYARSWVGNARNAIFFSGYIDEESPGRALTKMAEGKTVRLEGEEFLPRCEVKRFYFSAHADRSQLRHYVETLKPRALVLHHGFVKPMTSFAEALRLDALVWIPKIGDCFDPLEMPADCNEQKPIIVS